LPSAFSPQGQFSGELIGENADTALYLPGFFSAIVSAPWPPIEWPMIEQVSVSSGRSLFFSAAGSSVVT
jgi:hypothetical protein